MAKKTVRYRAEIIQAMTLGMGDTTLNPDDPDYAWRILSEGDSWFTIGAIPSSSLLYELHLKKRTVILNLGYPGDTIANISQLSANTELTRGSSTQLGLRLERLAAQWRRQRPDRSGCRHHPFNPHRHRQKSSRLCECRAAGGLPAGRPGRLSDHRRASGFRRQPEQGQADHRPHLRLSHPASLTGHLPDRADHQALDAPDF